MSPIDLYLCTANRGCLLRLSEKNTLVKWWRVGLLIGVNKHELHQFDLLPAVATRFIDTLALTEDDFVFEIGPGTGSLTAAMLAAGARVFAVEFDAERAAVLRGQFADALQRGQLQLLCGDARQLLPPPAGQWRIVANPPFMHTAEFMRQWLLDDLPGGQPQRIDVVLQQQAADKWCGERGMYTRSSVLAHLFGAATRPQSLRREDVQPTSHVDLCTWSLVRHDYAPSADDMRCVDTLLEIAFAGEHSMRTAVRAITTPAIIKRQGKMNHWTADDHPRSVSPDAWLALARFLRSIQKI